MYDLDFFSAIVDDTENSLFQPKLFVYILFLIELPLKHED